MPVLMAGAGPSDSERRHSLAGRLFQGMSTRPTECPLWVMSRLCENRPVLPLSTPKQTLELGMSAIRSEADRMTPLSYV